MIYVSVGAFNLVSGSFGGLGTILGNGAWWWFWKMELVRNREVMVLGNIVLKFDMF